MKTVTRMALLLLASHPVLAAESLGNRWVVVGIVGKWKTPSDGKSVYLGEPFPPGAELVRDPPTARSGFITLAYDKDTRDTHACENPGACASVKVKSPPAHAPESSSFREVLASWVEAPKRFVAAVSRDVGGLHDAVVQSSGKGADCGPAFSDLAKGAYWIKIDRLSPRGDQEKPVGAGPLNLPWDPAQPATGILPLDPGLYRLQIADQQGEATGGDAWVLVRTRGDFAKAQSAFQQILDQTASWREDVPPAGILAIHRARLEMLAR